MRVIELFAGIGSQTQALKNIGADHEVIAISEFDKFASKTYEDIHGPTNNLGDITKVKKLPKADMWTYSPPCQDISQRGLQKGLARTTNTRSGLIWEVERLLRSSKKPKYLLLENVKNLVSKKFKPDFDEWLKCLESMGYTNYWKVLTATDYGLPQGRQRVFCMSIKGKHKPFVFPEKQVLTTTIRDFLEKEVDEKYFLSDEKLSRLITRSDEMWKKGLHYRFKPLTENSIARTITTTSEANYVRLDNGRTRVLTPKENLRLMGFVDEQIDKIKNISNTQKYKQAGNSICVPVLEAVFSEVV